MAFGGIVIVDAYDCETRRLAALKKNEKARIVRLEDAGVGRGIAADPVPENFGRAVIFICPHIIKAKRIRHPYRVAARIGDHLRAVPWAALLAWLAGVQVADPNRI